MNETFEKQLQRVREIAALELDFDDSAALRAVLTRFDEAVRLAKEADEAHQKARNADCSGSMWWSLNADAIDAAWKLVSRILADAKGGE